jgi:predicted transcriptional regulator
MHHTWNLEPGTSNLKPPPLRRAYNRPMLRYSIPIGRFMNVDLRVHLSIPLLLLLAIGYSLFATGGATRGVALWLALCFAILVREVARAIAAAYAGLTLHALFLLPVGGLMALATPSDGNGASAANSRLLLLAGPIANFTVGLLLLGASYALEPQVSLFAQPWISTGHLLRSMVWMQIILGAVNLLPTTGSARDSKSDAPNPAKPAAPRTGVSQILPIPSFGLGTAIALAIIVAGILLMNLWLVILGGFLMLGSQISTNARSISATDAEAILVREVMLTEYTLLSSSDTLQGALNRTVHSLQDVFPIVRGDRLVGSIARQSMAERLLTDGDSYLQGIMTRSLQLASPTDKLVEALRRAASLGASEFIPVVEDGAMIGILTPQSLARAVQQVKTTRPAPNPREINRD